MRQAQGNPRTPRASVRAFIAAVSLALGAIAGTAAAQTASPVFRFFNSQTGTHFYTINQAERDFVLARYPQFLYEGPAYFAHPSAKSGNLPVYRFFNTRTGTHFYTQSESEKNFVLATYPVFAFEGPAYWAPASAGPGSVPLYRFFNGATGAHFFTTNTAERDLVLKSYPSFMYEGVAYQVLPAGGATPVNQAPVTKLTVSPGSVPTVPAIVTLTATATDSDGSVMRVEYYLGSDLIGTTLVAPHTMNFPITEPGTYGFRAVAYDNLGMPGSSSTVNVTAGSSSTNQPPMVTISVSPDSLPSPGQLTLTATAVDNDGTVTKVVFFDNGSKIGEVTSSPFVLNYNAATAKLYRFSATAYDDKGASASSPQKSVLVGPGANAAPKVTLAASPDSLPGPGAIMLTANATDEDGTIAKVAFYQNGTKIAEVTSAPFKTTFNAPSNAVYRFTAIATDNLGATATSADVNVSVGSTTNIAPKVSLSVSSTQIPFPGTVTMTATASDDDGTIARVRIYQNGTQRADITTPPYTFAYTTTVPGVYKFKATAYDNKGASTSTAEIDVTSGNAQQLNKKPTVSLSLSQTLVMQPATVTLTATAADPDGTITRVRFYRNGANIGEKTAAPFTMTDAIAANGQTRYRADATDNTGNVSTTLDQVVSAQTPPASAPRSADVWRLLNQATFGASQAEAANVAAKGGVTAWVDDQLAKPLSSGYPSTRYNRIQLRESDDCTTKDPLGQSYPSNSAPATCVRDHLSLAMVQRDFFTNAMTRPDQLRQRVAWALSQILVISGIENDLSKAHVMARYQQIMFEEAFGNFETILKRITLSPAMGNWLDSVNNDRPDAAKGRVPNENYAREILQLFSIGLIELKSDGTPLLDANDEEISTYDQDDIKQFARVFTGYTYANPDGSPITKKNGVYYGADMGVYPGTATTGHDTDAKTLLDVTSDGNANPTVLPAGQTPQQDIDGAVKNAFMHPNTGPFISKQLIQRLVTGNPTPAYVQRVAAKFANNGSGVRGDLKAVVRAILLDPEARGPAKTDPAFGTLREPVLMITGLVRALNGVTDGSALGDRAANLAQRPYYAPSVFNYFPPDATIPGTSILAPEFGIFNSNAAVARTNLVYSLVYGGISPDANLADATGTRLNTIQFEPLATDAALLTDKVSEVLLGGPLPAEARTAVITAVNAIALSATPTAQQKTDRARMATYLIAASNHYQIQR